MGDDKKPFKVIVRGKGHLQPSEVEIVTRDGKSVNQKLLQAGPLHNDAEVQRALESITYFSDQSRKSVASTDLSEAYSYARGQDWQKALNTAKDSIRANPDIPEAYHLAGLAAGQIYGLNSDESRFYYAKFVELEPDRTKKVFLKDIFPDLLK